MDAAGQRAAQSDSSESAANEATALKILTKANCSSTPTLLATKVVTQTETMWVPGGYLGFILMTKLSGIRIDQIQDLDLQERDEMRQSFKKAWW